MHRRKFEFEKNSFISTSSLCHFFIDLFGGSYGVLIDPFLKNIVTCEF